MKSITNIISRIRSRELPKKLGRWNIDYCNTKINNKIDLSNEDHCGPCGQYAMDAVNKINTENMYKKQFKPNTSMLVIKK